jgi:hypothetical protein
LGSNTGGGNGSVAITAEAPLVEPIASPSVLTPAPGTATLYKTKVAGVSKWAIKVGLLFSTGGDNRPAARLLTVQVYADRDGRPLSARPSDGQGSPGSASYTNGVVKWSGTGEVTRASVAAPVWVRVGNRTGKWSNWVQLSR